VAWLRFAVSRRGFVEIDLRERRFIEAAVVLDSAAMAAVRSARTFLLVSTRSVRPRESTSPRFSSLGADRF
jgi:hypothetical protein